MKTLKTTAHIIDVLGGNHAVAALLEDTTHKAVSNWRRSNLPANTFVVLQLALVTEGFYAGSWLWGMKQGKRKRKGKKQ